ncbi:carbonic anhydrase [Fomitopsis serialis]|uniref:carbonic anhydrase n=1 Tax=Fomitopsis serialis TaxID=139415 RepID=UPI0020084192|nr:carbonic anhydrase [Neoantrodia serialis]KAH9928085.1 carbonic anhydrase [Neoantrodia serialis]
MIAPNAAPPDTTIESLLARNEEWASGIDRIHPRAFHHMAKTQRPEVLWIGCADSRVPESVITASVPGDILVHRNIANQFAADDANGASVVQYAVEDLGVTHVLVVGHTQCGGVHTALEVAGGAHRPGGALGDWMSHLLHLAKRHPDVTALTEANVISTVDRVKNYIDNMKFEGAYDYRSVAVVGMIYELETGGSGRLCGRTLCPLCTTQGRMMTRPMKPRRTTTGHTKRGV